MLIDLVGLAVQWGTEQLGGMVLDAIEEALDDSDSEEK